MAVKFTIDPGHIKGYNVGVVKTYAEGTAMFNLAKYLKSELERYEGFSVILTRNAVTENPDLSTRGKIAINNKSDVFISLHSDAFSKASACGISVFRSLKLPNSKGLSETFGNAVASLMKQTTGVSYFRGSTTRVYPNTTNTDYYGVIRSSVGTGSKVKYSFLIEHGFHTNTNECTWLSKDANLKLLAATEAKVFADFFGANLKGQGDDKPTPTPPPTNDVEKYEVVVDGLQGYGNAADAKDGKNAKSTLKKGTYYIFRTYTNGCINITTDSKGVTPGSWINPAKNIAPTPPKPSVEKYTLLSDIPGYNTAADAAVGTNEVSTLKKGIYTIFRTYVNGCINITNDSTGKTPGWWINPKDNTPEDPEKPNPDDEFAAIDTSNLTPITMSATNMPVYTFEQAVAYVKENNPAPKLNCTVEELVYEFMRAGFAENIRWDIAFAQSIHETGFFKYGNQVQWEQNNYAGIGATNGGAAGATFATPYIGALAQMQHLKAYCNTDDCNEELVDPRFKYVTRGWAPYVEWLGMKENPKNPIYDKELGWAVPGEKYGASILATINKIKEM